MLVAAATASAVVGAVLMRNWDRAAGKRVADLKNARARDEWRTDERIAELETDLEESREIRTALEARLRGKRGELARLRNEHAELLRRYATAETERASALEGRRQLALEAAAPAKALPATTAALDGNGAPTPSAYLKADKALTELVRNGARQQAQRTVAAARRRDLAERREAGERKGKHAAAAGKEARSRTAADDDTAKDTPPEEHHKVPAAAAVVPYAPLRRPAVRDAGGFDFFGTQTADDAGEPTGGGRPESTATAPGPDEDLADVVGAEALAEHEASKAEEARPVDDADRSEDVSGSAEAGPEDDAVAEGDAGQGAEDAGAAGEPVEKDEPGAADASEAADESGEVIDLTEHDETEQIDVRELRAHTS
ncbi:hypothetical protein [Streptomyces sp. 8N706]|uniref:hypothetical protein n=1 Tax=Streptomyces sp. 8N706 TaxID=3457416 RepID=UPI003FD428A8